MPALSFSTGNQNPPSLLLLGMAGLFPQSAISILFTVILNSGNKKYQQAYELFL